MFLHVFDKNLYKKLLANNYILIKVSKVNNKDCYIMAGNSFDFSITDKSKYFLSSKLTF